MYVSFYILLLLALVAQIAWGNIVATSLAFPVSGALIVALSAAGYVIDKEYGHTPWGRQLRSPLFTCHLMGSLAAYCVLGGLMPPLPEATEPTGLLWLGYRAGMDNFPTSLPFITLLLCCLLQLTMVVSRRLRHGWRISDSAFILVHTGWWIAVASGFFGSSDFSEQRIVVPSAYSDNVPYTESLASTRTAYDRRGHKMALPYSLSLTRFEMTRNAADGTPSRYTAVLETDGRKTFRLEPGQPFAPTWSERLLLVSYDAASPDHPAYVIISRVCQPWRYGILIGILMLMAGTILFTIRPLVATSHSEQ